MVSSAIQAEQRGSDKHKTGFVAAEQARRRAINSEQAELAVGGWREMAGLIIADERWPHPHSFPCCSRRCTRLGCRSLLHFTPALHAGSRGPTVSTTRSNLC